MKAPRELRLNRVNLKLTDDEHLKMRTLMESYHYQSVSRFWRDLLAGKPLVRRRDAADCPAGSLADAMNRLTAQVTVIGRRYNHLVSRLDELSRQTRPDGSPVIGDGIVSGTLGMLRTQTEKLRDEVALCIDMVGRLSGRGTGGSQPGDSSR